METHVFQTKDGLMIEYSIRGAGRPVLVFHGGHSNCREEFGYDELLGSGYSLLTPSRAGYGQTSAEIGENLGTACQAYAELLDHLDMDRIDVIAVSAGGATGIYWASHYSERVRSLTLQSAVSGRWHSPQDKIYKVSQLLFGAFMEKYTWGAVKLMSNRFPRFMFKQMISSFSTLPSSEVLARTREDDILAFCKMNNRQRSGHGFLLDLPQINSITDSDLNHIRCPALIQHCPNDAAVPVEHARRAHQHIAGSKLQLLDTWGHLIWLGEGSEALHPELLAFLAQT